MWSKGDLIQVITLHKVIPKEVPMTNDKGKKQGGSKGSSDSPLHPPPKKPSLIDCSIYGTQEKGRKLKHHWRMTRFILRLLKECCKSSRPFHYKFLFFLTWKSLPYEIIILKSPSFQCFKRFLLFIHVYTYVGLCLLWVQVLAEARRGQTVPLELELPCYGC